MNILNFFLDNHDKIFYACFIGVTGVIGLSLIANSMNLNVLGKVQTFSKGTMTVPDTESTPRTFSFSLNQLRDIENYAEQATQTDSKLDGLLVPITNKGVQAVSDVSNIGIQVNPASKIESSALESVSMFRNVDWNNVCSVFRSTNSNSIQAVTEVRSAELKTLINNLNQGFQNTIDPNLIVRSDLVEYGTSYIPGIVDVTSTIVNYFPGV